MIVIIKSKFMDLLYTNRPGPVGGVGCISGGISIPVIFTYPRVSSFRIRPVYGAYPGTKYISGYDIRGHYYCIPCFCIEMYRELKMVGC